LTVSLLAGAPLAHFTLMALQRGFAQIREATLVLPLIGLSLIGPLADG